MSFETYKLIHFLGLFTLFFAFGSLFTGEKSTKAAAMGHGIGLLLMLLGGFGMQAKHSGVYLASYGSAFPMWLIIKVVIWLVLGGAMVLAKRRIITGLTAWILIIGLGFASAYLALNKPMFGSAPAVEAAAAE
ncbi:hypothetical protein OAI07_01035 [Akkermansiaceae bacterium]|nr:hypothetical protein [Akkermansiaceae bacterium]